MNETPSPPIQWHRLLGAMYELLLEGLDVQVLTDMKIMSDPPRADLVLIRRRQPNWSADHLARLPDGVRDSSAAHILLEFKYSQSVNRQVILKTLGYDRLYKEIQGLADEEVTTFIVSAKTPRQKLLQRYGYRQTRWSGVYRSDNVALVDVGILVLNALSDEPHNAFIKCFAGRRKEKKAAFKVLERRGGTIVSERLLLFLIGLQNVLFTKGDEMGESVTPEMVLEIGEKVKQQLLASMTVEERLAGMSEKVKQQLLASMTVEEVLARYKPEEVLARYKPEEVLARYKPEERLAGLEEYLKDKQQQAEKETVIRTLLRMLQARFGLSAQALEPVRERLRQLELAALEDLSEAVVLAESLADFEQRLN